MDLDPLVRVPPGPPCPSCGSTASLDALEARLEELRQRETPDRLGGVAVGALAGQGSSSVAIGRSAPLFEYQRPKVSRTQISGVMVCADCGTWWDPDTRKWAADLREKIRTLRLEKESAIDLLGSVGSVDAEPG